MHAAKIENDTAPGRLYRFMKNLSGQWLDAWELGYTLHIMALSTRMSEVRCQLPDNEHIEYKFNINNGRRYGYYRLVVE